ncbi:MAG: 1,4-dihydroxy-2-naphthoate polyprenyltransferase [Planctomycetaceae bacterium]|nr:1,4-dihydroxy-2-naphthoate polyprenyltransferase [Planctomycetaceae bacterium]
MFRVWLQAARPKTLLASVCPVMIGAALAYRDHVFHLPSALAALVGALSIQIGTNFCNDYCDFLQGADTENRKGPTRAVQAGLTTPRQMMVATIVSFLVTILVCIYLVYRAGWPFAVIGGLSILFGVLYTASRYSLAYLGLGDLFVLVFFGPVAVAGTYYVQALQFVPQTVIAGLAPGFISVGILVVNNLRDVDEDRAAKKRTLAVRFGLTFARLEYLVCILAAAAIPVCLWQLDYLPAGVLIASFMLAPGVGMARRLGDLQGAKLNPFLGRTAALLLGYTLIFCLGCVFVW